MRIYFRFVPALLFFFFLSRPAQGIAQSFETPVEYLDYIGKANEQLTLKYMVYLSSMSHGKSARKVEKRRLEVLDAINNTRMNIMGMPPYKGDKSFRDTTVAYLKILNSVFNEDFSKIVNMEEIAEQSYDAMEAYMLAQEKANEKLREAGKRQNEMQKVFAEKNNIKLLFNDPNFNFKQPALNKDNTKLFFVSDKSDTFGSTDIYYVIITNHGLNFSEPIHLNFYVNTPGEEIFPHIGDLDKLYFSSDGMSGLGGLDIFESFYNNGAYENTANLGEPINSEYDDFAFTLISNNYKGFFSSNRDGGSGGVDIYYFEDKKPTLNKSQAT